MQDKPEIKQLVENPEQFQYLTWLQTVANELKNMSDRATIIVMASILDVQLEKLLKAYLIDSNESTKLFKSNGPLSTFSSKINLCYCLGIISKHELNTINVLRRIRNQFAHEIQVSSFNDDQSTIDLSKTLSIPAGMYVPILLQVDNDIMQPFPVDVFDKADVRNKILLAFYYITNYLECRFIYLKKRSEFVAPPVWQLLEDTISKRNEIYNEYIDALQKLKETLTEKPHSQSNGTELDTIELALQEAASGPTFILGDDLNISSSQYENYCQSLISAIKKSYGVE